MTAIGEVELTQRLQRRVARRLLRLDRRAFRRRFRELYARSTLPQPPELRAYDEYTRLVALADELLDDILPRIRRQMSFQATRENLVEEAPMRGQIDGGASLRRGWSERPGQPPVQFATRLRSRTFDTPENRLVVAILQRYARQLGRTGSTPLFTDAPLTQPERHEFAQIADRIRRELGTLHFQELAASADDFDLPELIETVERTARGATNAYRDLIDWWRRFERLHFRTPAELARSATLDKQEALGLLYQLWIALELAEFLDSRGLLEDPRIKAGRLAFDFTWAGRTFHFVYDRSPAEHLVWAGAPGERPDYFITRSDPVLVTYKGQRIWREPGVVLDAKCYLGDNADRTSGPVKRMLADLQLVDATKGGLILPDIHDIPAHVFPEPDRFLGSILPEVEIKLYELQPLVPIDELHSSLATILDQVCIWLPERPPVRCIGYWQDVDTRNPDGTRPLRCPTCGEVMAFCPKPHVSARRVNPVCPRCDCLKNPQLCHIIDRAEGLVPPFVSRVLTKEQLTSTIETLRSQLRRPAEDDETDEAEHARHALFAAIGELTETYIKLSRADTAQIALTLEWALAPYWRDDQHLHGLPATVRTMLVSGEYVWHDFQGSSVEDWAASAVQFVRALEHEMQRRIYEPCGAALLAQDGAPMQPKQFTFATPYFSYALGKHNGNRQTLADRVAMPSGLTEAELWQLFQDIEKLRIDRNAIAHTDAVDKALAARVHAAVIGSPGAPGLLRRLLALKPPA